MNTFSPQNCFNPYGLLFPQLAAFFYSVQQSSSSETCFKKLGPSQRFQPCQYKLVDEVESPSFETRFQPSIIIRSNTELSHSQVISSPTLKQGKKTKPIPKKITQKQSRNVASNLLRIFLKHVIEVKFYDEDIQKMIKNQSLQCTLNEFHSWLASFGINYKNYIRFTEIKRVLNDTKHQQMRGIFKMLLRKYSRGVGVEHCLTSRRIDRHAIPMHLSGLRELLQQAITE